MLKVKNCTHNRHVKREQLKKVLIVGVCLICKCIDVIRIALKGVSLKLSEIFHSIPLVSIVICVHCCWLG